MLTRTWTDGETSVELPIVCRKGRAFFAAWPAPVAPLEALLPDRGLRAIRLWPGTSALFVAIFDYQDTTIGPYHEVAVGFPCRYQRRFDVPLLPLLAERWLPDVAHWLHLLPVTTAEANRSGRPWGYPKFVADIDVRVGPSRVECRIAEAGATMMSIEIDRPARSSPSRWPLRTYSRRGDELLLTEIDIDSVGATRKLGARARLRIEDHPRNGGLNALSGERSRAIEVRWFDEYRAAVGDAHTRYPLDEVRGRVPGLE